MNRPGQRDRGGPGVETRRSFGARLAGFFWLTILGFGPASMAAANPIRIMPLGDSITYGLSAPVTDPGGYRATLFRDLTAAGFDPYFVGSRIDNPDLSLPPQSSPHEGHSGYQIDATDGYKAFSINPNIEKWLAPGNGVYPDFILLMAGSNSIVGRYHLAAAPYELAALITRISHLRPEARILVSTLTPQASAANEYQVQQFNKALSGPSGIVAQLRKLGENVTLVDVGSALTRADLSDEVHPTYEGYRKLGDAWFRAIQLNNPIPAPEPSGLALLGLGFAGVVAAGRARTRPTRA
jgi:hypothetical protein